MKGERSLNLFEKQTEKRREHDNRLLESTFVRTAAIIYGQRTADELLDESIITERAIDEIFRYYHMTPPEIPEEITDSDEQLDYCLRCCGFMKRRVVLTKGWYKNAYGVMLTHRKDSGEPVVLTPDKLGTGYRFRERSGEMKKVNSRTAELFEESAYCFYKPLPDGKLTAKDLLLYMKGCMRANEWVRLAVFVLIMTALGLLIPPSVRVLSRYAAAIGKPSLIMALGAFLLCTVISARLINTAVNTMVHRLGEEVSVTVHSALMMRILRLPAQMFENIGTGEFAGISAGADKLCETLITSTAGVGLVSIASLLYVWQIYRLSVILGNIVVLVLLLTVGLGLISAFIRAKTASAQLKQLSDEARTRYTVINGIRKIRLAGAEKRFFAKWLGSYGRSRKLTYSPSFFIRISGLLTLAVGLAANIRLFYTAADCGITKEEYIAFTLSFAAVTGAFSALAEKLEALGEIRPTLGMLEAFLQAEPESSVNKQPVSELKGAVELGSVSFRYSEGFPYILRNFSLRIRPKEYVAVVGKTGCGKSTLIKLLLGLRVPEKGAVYYDGKDLNSLEPSTLRSKIGTVMQNGDLFQGTVLENITITAPKATLDDAWAAAETAGIADDIRAMPMGMQTLVSAGQGGISGGQKQRILIARAIVGKPRILIFDEDTSALDNITQRQVSEALDKMGCTRIVIAHRLSTIRHCDRIVVLDKGGIAEDGSYEELIAKDGIFAELVRRQRADV